MLTSSRTPNLIAPDGGFKVYIPSTNPETGEDEYITEVTGEAAWGSPYNDTFPFFQPDDYSNAKRNRLIGKNIHSAEPYGPAVDIVLNCVLSADPAKLEVGESNCGAISDTVTTVPTVANNAIIQPIFPENNASTMVGVILTGLQWSNILTGMVPSSISGLDFVLASPMSKNPPVTYRITRGIPEHLGEGDFHDSKYNCYKRSTTLSLSSSLSPDSLQYTVSMYPRKEFIDIYTTDNPRNITIEAVALIVLTSITFLVYDYFMQRCLNAKEFLLQTKRQFVRFISHEVRTPLNAVAMGLKLLENEFDQAFADLEEEDAGEKIDGSHDKEERKEESDQQQQEGEEEKEKDGKEERAKGDAAGESEGESDGYIVVPEIHKSEFALEVSDCAFKFRAATAAPAAAAETVAVTHLPRDRGVYPALILMKEKIQEQRKAQIQGWRQLVVDVTENTASAVFVLDDLLNYDKIETGSLRLELKQADIWQLLRKTVHTFDLAAKQVKVHLTLQVVNHQPQRQRQLPQQQQLEDMTSASFISTSSIPTILPPVITLPSIAESIMKLGLSTVPAAAYLGYGGGKREENIVSRGSQKRTPLVDDLEAGRGSESPVFCDAVDDVVEDEKEIDDDGDDDDAAAATSHHALCPSLHSLHSTASFSAAATTARTSTATAFAAAAPAGEEDEEEVGSGVVDVLGDCTRLAQVVRNLISNALKFTPEGGSITVLAEWSADGVPTGSPREALSEPFPISYPRAGSLRLSVTDTGAGLTEDQLARICSEGVQFNANELQGGRGSGLGLFITKGIVEQHGGSMVVTSGGIGCGTTFTVELPLYRFPTNNNNDNSNNENNDNNMNIKSWPSMSEYDLPRAFSETRNISVSSFTSIPLNENPLDIASSCIERPENDASRTVVGYKPTPTSTSTHTPCPTPERSVAEVSLLPKRVLVVDDAPSNRKMLVRLLSRKGCDCVEARNGQEAVDIFKKTVGYINSIHNNNTIKNQFSHNCNPADEDEEEGEEGDKKPIDDFDVILMDFEMPILNGPDAAKVIRDLGGVCMIMGITGNVLPADMKHFVDQGANTVLPKPLQLETLTQLWHKHQRN